MQGGEPCDGDERAAGRLPEARWDAMLWNPDRIESSDEWVSWYREVLRLPGVHVRGQRVQIVTSDVFASLTVPPALGREIFTEHPHARIVQRRKRGTLPERWTFPAFPDMMPTDEEEHRLHLAGALVRTSGSVLVLPTSARRAATDGCRWLPARPEPGHEWLMPLSKLVACAVRGLADAR
jgi:hypothetical protein